MTSPIGGAEIGKGYVEIRAEVDQESSVKAGEELTKSVQAEVDKSAPVIGKSMGDGAAKGLETTPEWDAAADRVAKKLGADLDKGLQDVIPPVGDRAGTDLTDALAYSAGRRAKWQASQSDSSGGGLLSGLLGMFGLGKGGGDKFEKSAEAELTPAMKKAGLKAAPSLLGALSDGVEGAGGFSEFLMPAAIGAAIPLGIALGGGIGTYAATAIAAAPIGLGIYEAFKSPLIKQALGEFKIDAKTELAGAGQAFVNPVATGLAEVRGEFDALMPGLSKTMAKLAPISTSIFEGVADFAADVVPAIESASTHLAPLLQDIGPDIAEVGRAVASAIGSISAHEGDLKEDLFFITQVVSNGIAFAGKLLEGLITISADVGKTVYDTADDVASGIKEVVDVGNDLGVVSDSLTKKIDHSAAGLHQMRQATDAARTSATKFGQDVPPAIDATTQSIDQQIKALGGWDAAFQKANGGAQDLEQATEAVEAAIDAMTSSVKQNGKSLDVNTEKGRANRSAILAGVQAAEAAAQAKYKETGSVSAATATYDRYIKRLEDAAIKAGLNKKQVDALVKSLGGLPTNLKVNVAIHISGADRLNRLNKIAHQLGNRRSGGVRRAASGLGNVQDDMSDLTAGFYPSDGIHSLVMGDTTFDEPGTGGEWFIPANGDKARNAGLISSLAASQGMQVTGAGSGPMEPPQAYQPQLAEQYFYTINLNGPWNAVDPMMPRKVLARLYAELKRYEKSNHK